MENNLDKLFKSKLEGQEPEFHPAAWDRMEMLLDDEGLIASQHKRQRRAGWIYVPILLLGIILSIFGYIKLNPSELVSEGSTLTNSIELKDKSVDIHVDSKKMSPEIILQAEPNKHIKQNNATQSSQNQNITTQNTRFDDKNVNQEIQDFSMSIIEDSQDIAYPNEEIGIEADAISQDVNSDVLLDKYLSLIDQDNNVDQGNSANSNDSQFKDEDADRIMLDSPVALTLGANDTRVNDSNSLKENILPIDGVNRFIEIELLNKTTLSEITGNKSEELLTPIVQIFPHQNQVSSSLFEFGIKVTSRFNNGLGYAFGPFVTYKLGNGYNLGIGGQIDVQKFEFGPGLSVFDKEYSFGSTITERKFSMDHQKSIRLPIEISKSFRQFELSTGMIFYKTIASNGKIAASSDGSISPSQNIDNPLIKSQYISFQLETAIKLNRYFKLGIGVEYKPQTLLEDQNTSNNQNTFYPTLGLEYIFFKF